MKKKNDWEQRFGAKRRAIDMALLAECERQIEAEEIAAAKAEQFRLIAEGHAQLDEDARRRIAAAFGRLTG